MPGTQFNHLSGMKCVARDRKLCPEKVRPTAKISPPDGLKSTTPNQRQIQMYCSETATKGQT